MIDIVGLYSGWGLPSAWTFTSPERLEALINKANSTIKNNHKKKERIIELLAIMDDANQQRIEKYDLIKGKLLTGPDLGENPPLVLLELMGILQ